MSPDDRSRIYDQLYDEASDILARDNPCQADCNSCADSRARKSTNAFCCHGCKHLGPQGCTVKALACRVWLCYHTQATHPQTYIALKDVKRRAEDAGIYMAWRGSKQECLGEATPHDSRSLARG